MKRFWSRNLLPLGALAGPLLPAEPSRILVPGARVITGNGAPSTKANVLVKDGLIEAVRTVGLDTGVRIGGPPQPTPAASATDAAVAATRNAGFTSAVVFPRQGIFAGQGPVVNLGGEGIRRVTVEPAR